MDGLPFIPGFRFNDITKLDFNLSTQFQWKNGYALPKDKSTGIGKSKLDADSILYGESFDVIGYNPELTYGKAKDDPKPIDLPHFVKLDRKCLSYYGYAQHTILNSPIETFRVRKIKITYFLVDDTIVVTEPVVKNAGYVQGCILKRGQIPNPHREGRPWHWSDFIIGEEISFYGIAYRLCGCDLYTRKFLTSMGMVVIENQPMIADPYTINRQTILQHVNGQSKSPDGKSAEDKLRQFLEYDGKVLRFYATWNNDISDPTECKYFIVVYYLKDDRLEINESKTMGNTCELNPSAVFLSKIKLPKHWSNLPPNFPSIYLEAGNEEYREYYRPKDFIVGNAINVMGRRFMLYDCDPFTRDYYNDILKIVQPEPIQIIDLKNNDLTVTRLQAIPPHTGIGEPDDTLQNCLSLVPKPPKTLDFVTFVLNATKKLRYKLKMVPVYEVDNLRDFIMEYCIGNDQMCIVELASKNSGFYKGRFMSSVRLRKPGTSIDSNQFYGPKDFAIGAELYAKGLVFIITELDVWSYKYMIENKDMFTQDAIDGAKRFLESKNLLKSQENVDGISVHESTPILSDT